MKVKRLKEILNNLDDNLEVFIRNSLNICGTIGELEQVEKSFYGFLGEDIPCLILNTSYSKKLETTDEENYIDYIESDNKKIIGDDK
jgi:hypothetical protein